MTDQEKAEVQELLDSLARCDAGQCKEIAVMSHPTAAIGDWMFACAKHPGATENEYGDKASPTRWAAVAARFVAQGFRSSR
jgi:hypothetical protein